MKTTILIELEHNNPLHPDITDIVSQRVYSIKGVKNTTASLLVQRRTVPEPYDGRTSAFALVGVRNGQSSPPVQPSMEK